MPHSPHLSFRFRFLAIVAGTFGPAALLAQIAANKPLSLAINDTLPALLTSAIVLILTALTPRSGAAKAALPLAIAACIGSHYPAIGKVIQTWLDIGWISLHDKSLLNIDRTLLDWLFPQGQWAIWIDQNPALNGDQPLGKILTDLFQLFYFSYYFWGYAVFMIVWIHYLKTRSELAWQNVARFLCAWAGAYFINFIAYVFVPAIGPRYIYREFYQHELHGYGLARLISDFILANQGTSQDCFPSGHTSLSWITALMAKQLAPRLAPYATAATIVITGATLFLRYHYTIDVLAAPLLIAAGLWWGRPPSPSKPKNAETDL